MDPYDSDNYEEVHDDELDNEDFIDNEDYGEIAEGIEEKENYVQTSEQYIKKLQTDLNSLYLNLSEDNLDLEEFQEQSMILQEQILRARIELLNDVLDLDQYKSLQKELDVFMERIDKEGLSEAIHIKKFEGKKEILSSFRLNFESEINKIIKKYQNLRKEEHIQEEQGLEDLVDEDEDRVLKIPDDSGWFLTRLPRSKEEEDKIIRYFKEHIPRLKNKDIVQIFGDEDEARNLLNLLSQSEDCVSDPFASGCRATKSVYMNKLSHYYPRMVATFSDYGHDFVAIFRKASQEELEQLKKDVLKYHKNKKEVENDFLILRGKISSHNLNLYMENNGITDPETALKSLQAEITSKYTSFIKKQESRKKIQKMLIKFKSKKQVPVRRANILEGERKNKLRTLLSSLDKQYLIKCVQSVCNEDKCEEAFKPNLMKLQKETKYRTLVLNRLYGMVLNIPLEGNFSNDVIMDYLTKLENIVASLYPSVLVHKRSYLDKIRELLFIFETHNKILLYLVEGRLTPSDIINIRSSFNVKIRNDNITLTDLLKWEPNIQVLSNYPDVYSLVLSEVDNSIPNNSVITLDRLKHVTNVLEKKSIIQSSYEYITWKTAVKKVQKVLKSSNNEKKQRLRYYLLSVKEKLPSVMLKLFVAISTRVKTVSKLEAKAESCEIHKKVLAHSIETAVLNLVDNTTEYNKVIDRILSSNSNNFCKLGDNNINMVYEIASKYVLEPERKVGKTYTEILLNSSIKVLNAIRSVQVNIDNILHQEQTKKEEKEKSRKQIELNRIIALKKKTTEEQINNINEGKLNPGDIKKVDLKKLSENPFDDWRKNVYTPSVYSQTIPHNADKTKIDIIPLPEERGYLLGGNYPDDPKAYRYIKNGVLKSHIETIILNFNEIPFSLNYENNDIDQPVTQKENILIGDVEFIRRRVFRLKSSFDYTGDELDNICQYSGYGEIDPQDMYQICILNNVEQTSHVKYMTLKEYKIHMLQEAKKGNLLINGKKVTNLTDSYILQKYYSMKSEKHTNKLNSFRIFGDGSIYKTKYNKSIQFPVPVEHIGLYPVYTKNQLEDLSGLLLSGKLSPWLVNNVFPIITKGNVTGFTGNPPWYIKDMNPVGVQKYLKSKDFRSVKKIDRNRVLVDISIEFGFYKTEKVEKLVLDSLNTQKDFINKGAVESKSLQKTYKYLGLLNPHVLRNKIIDKNKALYKSYDHLVGEQFKLKSTPQQREDLQNIIKYFGFLNQVKVTKANVLSKIEKIKNEADQDINHLDDKEYWNGLIKSNYSKAMDEYNDIAVRHGITTEQINKESLHLALNERLRMLENSVNYLKSVEYDVVTDKNKQDILRSMIRDMNLVIVRMDTNVRKLIKFLEKKSGDGLMSNFYIEKEFTDKYGKKLIVKEGISKSKISWKDENWDPCNFYSSSERNALLLNTIKYIENSEDNIRNNFLKETLEYWGIRHSGQQTKEEVIKSLSVLIDKNQGFTRCEDSTRQNRVCYWNNENKTCNTKNYVPIKVNTPLDKVNKVLEKYGDIENMPVDKSSMYREFKEYKKEDKNVWLWYPVKKPKDNTVDYQKWLNNPVVKSWNAEVNKSLGMLKRTLYNRTRVSSKSFKKQKQEETVRLEKFRKHMKSEIPEEKKRMVRNPKIDMEAFVERDDVYDRRNVTTIINRMLRYKVICLTVDAKRMMDIINNKLSTPLEFIGNYRKNMINKSLQEVSDNNVYIYEILRNMSYTRQLKFNKGGIELSNMGILYDYLVQKSNLHKIKNKQNNIDIHIPNKCIEITVRDVLDYLGDSYMQYIPYRFGISANDDDNYTYLNPGCRYTDIAEVDNPFITFEPESNIYQNTYVVGNNLHKSNSVSTNVARRLSYILGINTSSIPPCFSTKYSEREHRSGSVITSKDIHTYFTRGGKSFTFEELEEDDVENFYSKIAIRKMKEEQLELKDKYKKAIKLILRGGVNKEMVEKYELNKDVLKKFLTDIKKLPEERVGNYISNIEIPIINTQYYKNKLNSLNIQFKEKLGVDLSDYLKNNERSKPRPVNIESWSLVRR